MRKTLQIALVMLATLVASSTAANATTIVYNFTSDHCTGNCGPVGTIFGTVTLSDNLPGSNTVDITVALSSGYGFVKTGAGDLQAFLFNGVGVSLADITINAHTPTLAAAQGAFGQGAVGTFGFGINCPTCAQGGAGFFVNPIVFHVANATLAELTVPNALGNVFVSDIINLSTGTQFSANTGLVDATVPNRVPDGGSTAALLGSVLLGVGMLRRKFGKV